MGKDAVQLLADSGKVAAVAQQSVRKAKDLFLQVHGRFDAHNDAHVCRKSLVRQWSLNLKSLLTGSKNKQRQEVPGVWRLLFRA